MVTSTANAADQLLFATAALQAAEPSFSTLGAAILAAPDLGIAEDSRTFARRLGLPHALVLREISHLSDSGHIAITGRDARTQRTWYDVTAKGRSLLDRALQSSLDAGGKTAK